MNTKSDQLYFRKLNKTYYRDLERLHQLLVLPNLRVLEIGSGAGDLLALMQPSFGVGIEIDIDKVNLARDRFPELIFKHADAESLTSEVLSDNEKFDIIIINNTLNLIHDVQLLFQSLRKYSHPGTRLILSYHNWLWQPFLKFAEIIGQREKQPPESWLTPGDINNLLDISGWESLKSGQRCIIPTLLTFSSIG